MLWRNVVILRSCARRCSTTAGDGNCTAASDAPDAPRLGPGHGADARTGVLAPLMDGVPGVGVGVGVMAL